MSATSGRTIAIAVTLVMALVVGIGIYLSGSPATAREEALDERRVDDLREAKAGINAWYRTHRLLPPGMDSVNPTPADSAGFRDPVTRTPYEYRAVNDSVYELCAVFSFASPGKPDFDWRHAAGRHCFILVSTQPY